MILWIWLGVVISLILTEILSRNFTAFCFVISGIISCIMTNYTNDYMMQVIQFLVVGILLLVIVRPFLLKKIQKRNASKDKNISVKRRKRTQK